MPHRLNIAGAPSSAGAYAPGQEQAPAAFRRHGLFAALRKAGIPVRDLGDTGPFRWRPDRRRPRGMNVEAVRATARDLARRAQGAFARDDFLLVLGGDCTVELGTVAAAQRTTGTTGLVYFDLDADLNTADTTTDGAFDGMGVAHLLGLKGAERRLSRLDGPAPALRPEQVLLFACGAATAPERTRIEHLRIAEIPVEHVARAPAAAARRAVEWASHFDRLLIHVDFDVLDYRRFPTAENTRRGVGLALPQLHRALQTLLAAPNCAALTLTEINPAHAPDERAAFARIIAMLVDVLKQRFPATQQRRRRPLRPDTPSR